MIMPSVSRRSFLTTSVVATAASSLHASALATVGVQLYTVRKVLPKKPLETLRAIEQIGYREVECTADHLDQIWPKYLAELSSSTLSKKIDYKNTKGESWSSTVNDILTHVLFHSAYHRGQIAVVMRAAGITPAYTDFIHGVRQGLTE